MRSSFLWIRQCILSSKSEFHLQCCGKLIDLFEKQYEKDENGKHSSDCSWSVIDLKEALREKETFLIVEV